ncbi:MAG TPA: hypothetical protein VGC88_05150 [Terriglobales bacterium]
MLGVAVVLELELGVLWLVLLDGDEVEDDELLVCAVQANAASTVIARIVFFMCKNSPWNTFAPGDSDGRP